MIVKKLLLVLACLTAVVGCSDRDSEAGPAAEVVPADSLTRQQRDSVIGASRLPGAGGVRGALEASDAAASRAATHDSLAGGLRP